MAREQGIYAPSTLRTVPGSVSEEFQLIEVATRRIVLADRASIVGGDVGTLAHSIVGDVINAIYPPRLISMADPGALVISEGGDGIHLGQRFRLMSEGEEMFDPYTHESLGRTERVAGVIEVTEVDPRLSYGKLVDGVIPPGTNIVLRSVPEAAPAPAPTFARPPRRKARRDAVAPSDAGQGGVRLPGDR